MQLFRKHRMRGIFFPAICAMLWTIYPAAIGMAAPQESDTPFSVSCQNISYRSCLDKISEAGKTKILAPSQLDAKVVTINLEGTNLLDSVEQATKATGVANYAFNRDVKQNILTVIVPDLAAAMETPAAATTPAVKAPSKEQAGMLDAKQLEMLQARAELGPDPDAPLGLDTPDGKPITLRQIEEIIHSQPPVPAVVVPPDAQISAEELEKILKKNMEQSRDINQLPDGGGTGESHITFDNFKKKYDAEVDAYKAMSQKTPEETVMGFTEVKK